MVPLCLFFVGLLLGPPPTQLDVVVDLVWCDVRTVAVTDTEFDRFGTPRTERLFLTATDNVFALHGALSAALAAAVRSGFCIVAQLLEGHLLSAAGDYRCA